MAGEFKRVRVLSVALKADTTPFGKGLAKAANSVDKFYAGVSKAISKSPFGFAARSVSELGKGFANLGKSAVAPLKPLADGLASVGKQAKAGVVDIAKLAAGASALAAAGLAAGAAFATGGLKRIGEVGRESLTLGIASDKLTELQFAAKASGAQVEDLNAFLSSLKDTVHASIGNAFSPAARAFAALGTSAEELSKLTPDRQFDRLKKGFEALPDAAARADAAVKIGGEAGLRLFKLLGMGAREFEALKQKAKDTGFTVSPADLAKVQAANAALATIGSTLDGVVNQLTIAVAPAVTFVANAFTDWFAGVSKDSKFFDQMIDGFVGGFAYLSDTVVGVGITIHQVFADIAKSIGVTLGNLGAYIGALSGLNPALKSISENVVKLSDDIHGFGVDQSIAARMSRAAFEKMKPSEVILGAYDRFKEATRKKAEETAKDTKQTQLAATANTDLASSVGDTLKEFHNAVSDAGLTAEMKRVAEMKRAGANPFDVAQARRMAPHAREAGKRDSLAEELRESTKLPAEKLGEDLARIGRLAAEGKITRTQAIRGAAQKTAESGVAGGQVQLSGAIQANSIEGRSYLLSQMMGQPQDAVEVARQGVAATMQGNGILSRILAATGRPDVQVSF